MLEQLPTASDGSEESNNSTLPNTAKQDDHETARIKAVKLAKFRLHHYFDYVAGSSTGGSVCSRLKISICAILMMIRLSALMLARMRMDISQALKQYKLVGNAVFASPRPKLLSMGGIMLPKYSAQNMVEVIQRIVSNSLHKEASRREEGVTPNDIGLKNENPLACNT